MKRQKKGGLILLIGLILCGSLVYRVVDASKLRMDRQREVLENEQSIQKLTTSIESLTREIKKSDSMDYVEEVARKDLGMVKPREIVFVDENKDKEDLQGDYEGGK